MENELENQGLDPVPTPTKQDKYADYRELNQPTEQEGKPEPKVEKVEVKADEKSKSDEASNQKKEHEPDYVKTIKRQHAENKSLKARLSEFEQKLEALNAPKVETPKYKKENFASEDEYIEYIAELKAKELLDKERESYTKQQTQEAEAHQKAQEWQQTWTQTVQDNFKDDPQGLQAFVQKIQNPELTANFSPEIHSYIESAPLGYGARLLDALIARPDLVDRVNRAHASIRPALLYDLEKELKTLFTAKPATAQAQPSQSVAKPVSNAPAPTGGITARGATVDEGDKDNQAYDRYMRKRFG
jgi:hypothetical protein